MPNSVSKGFDTAVFILTWHSPIGWGYHLNRLDKAVFMEVPKPMLTEFGIHYRLESCEEDFIAERRCWVRWMMIGVVTRGAEFTSRFTRIWLMVYRWISLSFATNFIFHFFQQICWPDGWHFMVIFKSNRFHCAQRRAELPTTQLSCKKKNKNINPIYHSAFHLYFYHHVLKKRNG